MDRSPSRIALLGKAGVITLLLSNVVIVATLASVYVWQLARIMVIARKAADALPDDATLVVLGMRLNGNVMTPDYRCRLECAYTLYRQQRTRQILILGGRSGTSQLSEAECGRNHLVTKGVSAQDVVIEDGSLDTLENLRNARTLLANQGQHNLIMITSRYHLARSEMIARGLGMTPILCGAERDFRLSPRILGRLILEAYFAHWYWVGATWSRLVGWKHSLGRIS